MLCWFLPYISMNQPQVYTCPLPLEPLSHLPPHPTVLVCQSTGFELPASCSRFPLESYFPHGNVYMSALSVHPTLSFPHCVLKSDEPVCRGGILRHSGFVFFIWLCLTACGTLVPQPGIEPMPFPNHWTAREFPRIYF